MPNEKQGIKVDFFSRGSVANTPYSKAPDQTFFRGRDLGHLCADRVGEVLAADDTTSITGEASYYRTHVTENGGET